MMSKHDEDKLAELSAWLDGEVDDPAESARLARLAASDALLNERWQTYHLIGDALRGDAGVVGRSVADRVREALQHEPVILAPRAFEQKAAPQNAITADPTADAVEPAPSVIPIQEQPPAKPRMMPSAWWFTATAASVFALSWWFAPQWESAVSATPVAAVSVKAESTVSARAPMVADQTAVAWRDVGVNNPYLYAHQEGVFAPVMAQRVALSGENR